MNDEFELISRYTRADALADGVLVDVTNSAKQAGIKYPTAVTQAVFEKYIRVPDGVTGQDEAGRIWDILQLLAVAIRLSAGGDSLAFTVLVRNDNLAPQRAELKALCHPGDDAEPVITILLPDED